MIRVLHLLDSTADFQTQRGVEALNRHAGDGYSSAIQTIGRGGTQRNLAAAVWWLRRGAEIDVIHAWGQTALTAAAMAGRGKIIHTVCAEAGRSNMNWLRAVLSCRKIEVVVPTATLHRACIQRGIPHTQCHLIRPGADFSRVKRRQDADLRQRLGLAESDYVLLAAGESTRAAAHERAVWTCAILAELDPAYKLLCWGRGPRAAAVARFAGHLRKPQILRIAQTQNGWPVDYETLLPAADAVLVTATAPVATLPIAATMAAGVPIVSTVTPAVAELLEDRHTALMVATPTPRHLARRVLDLREDAAVQRSLVDRARAEAFEFFALTRFIDQHRALYRQLCAAVESSTALAGNSGIPPI